jgi:mono/diheme cytochrome c family protein
MQQPQAFTPTMQRDWLCRAVPDLSHDAMVKVLQFIQKLVPGAKVNIHADGSSVNLDKLDDVQIWAIYQFAKSLHEGEMKAWSDAGTS